MLNTITTPPRTRKLDLEDLTTELFGISDMLIALSFPFMDGTERLTDSKIADVLNAVSSHINRIADDISEFTVTDRGA